MNFPYNKIFVAQKLSEWQNFKDCTLFAAVCGAKDKLESVPRMWEYVPNCVEGPGKCGISLSDMFGGMCFPVSRFHHLLFNHNSSHIHLVCLFTILYFLCKGEFLFALSLELVNPIDESQNGSCPLRKLSTALQKQNNWC